jgi:hypothetical protein
MAKESKNKITIKPEKVDSVESLIKVEVIEDINHCINDKKIIAQKGDFITLNETELMCLRGLVKCH